VLERAAILARSGEIEIDERILPAAAMAPSPAVQPDIMTAAQMESFERDNIVRALEACSWKIAGAAGAAQLLGLAPSTLTSRMKALGIERRGGMSASALA
jgi:transcriptional regulator with GAF, ATPase, and Fis domain